MSKRQDMIAKKDDSLETNSNNTALKTAKKEENQDAGALIQRVAASPGRFYAGDVLKLQRMIGNKAVSSVLTSGGAPVQAKLAVGTPGDVYEREADDISSRVAEQVNMNQSPGTHESGDVDVQASSSSVQRIIGILPITPLGIQMKGGGEEAAPDGLESRINSARGGGQGMPVTLQTKMEEAFGADFSGVRIHTGNNSEEMNSQLGARAFTTGQDIFFNKGEYSPGTKSGNQILAHELTHVVQQGPARKIQRDFFGWFKSKKRGLSEEERKKISDTLDQAKESFLVVKASDALKSKLRELIGKCTGNELGINSPTSEAQKFRENLKKKARQEAEEAIRGKFKEVEGFEGDREGQLTARAQAMQDAAIKDYAQKANSYVISMLQAQSSSITEDVLGKVSVEEMSKEVANGLFPELSKKFMEEVQENEKESIDEVIAAVREKLLSKTLSNINDAVKEKINIKKAELEEAAHRAAAEKRGEILESMEDESVISGEAFGEEAETDNSLEDTIEETDFDTRSENEKAVDAFLYDQAPTELEAVVSKVVDPGMKPKVFEQVKGVAMSELGAYGGFFNSSSKEGYKLRTALKKKTRSIANEELSGLYNASENEKIRDKSTNQLTGKGAYLETNARADMYGKAKEFVLEIIEHETVEIAETVSEKIISDKKAEFAEKIKGALVVTLRGSFGKYEKKGKSIEDKTLAEAKEKSMKAAIASTADEVIKVLDENLKYIKAEATLKSVERRNKIVADADLDADSAKAQVPEKAKEFLSAEHEKAKGGGSLGSLIKSVYTEEITAPDVSGGFSAYASAVDAMVPNDGDYLKVDFKIAIPAMTGLDVTLRLSGEAKREKEELKTALEYAVGIQGDFELVSIGTEIGGFFEVQAKGKDNVALLLSYIMYHKLKDSSLVPAELVNHLWSKGGKSGLSKEAEAERWANAVEEQVFGDDDDAYAEEGSLATISAEGDIGDIASASGTIKGKTGKKYSKDTLGEDLGKSKNSGIKNNKGKKSSKEKGQFMDVINLSSSVTIGDLGGGVEYEYKKVNDEYDSSKLEISISFALPPGGENALPNIMAGMVKETRKYIDYTKKRMQDEENGNEDDNSKATVADASMDAVDYATNITDAREAFNDEMVLAKDNKEDYLKTTPAVKLMFGFDGDKSKGITPKMELQIEQQAELSLKVVSAAVTKGKIIYKMGR